MLGRMRVYLNRIEIKATARNLIILFFFILSIHALFLIQAILSLLERDVHAQVIFKEATDEFTTKVTKSMKRARALIEASFDFVLEMDGLKFFRKRK